VVVLNRDDSAADLSGWVTIDNKSGASYKDARLKLVAGEVHRAPEPQVNAVAVMAERAKQYAPPRVKEEAFFEYHLYDFQRRTTVKNKQTKQLSLLDAQGIEVAKELVVHGVKNYLVRRYRPKTPKQPVDVYVKFVNSKENNLGIPLPAGVMRLYKNDADASQQFLGEDRIEHTPKDEKVKLKIGEAFDVIAERRQTDYKRISSHLHESEWEITLRNHKETDVKVGIVEPLFGNWRVMNSSHEYEKVDAFTIRFEVEVPTDGEVKVTYRARVGI
jgi:hypothetical protein